MKKKSKNFKKAITLLDAFRIHSTQWRNKKIQMETENITVKPILANGITTSNQNLLELAKKMVEHYHEEQNPGNDNTYSRKTKRIGRLAIKKQTQIMEMEASDTLIQDNKQPMGTAKTGSFCVGNKPSIKKIFLKSARSCIPAKNRPIANPHCYK
ncbi:hypothetical protein BB558_004220 [Smittium angustum]|uniref:Uncharacterized protein n=1 Tax=Smittium angustum TaxID=133377 RepID=A0A2U1J3X2_SMIAN|nr:hypothetical protein BB558_004220 [Smittium angustum]